MGEAPKARLFELRHKLGLTQEQFSNEVGISKTTISNNENSSTPLRIDIALAIAEKYKVSLDWLYGLKENESTNVLDSFRSFFSLGKREIAVENKALRSENTFLTICLSQAAIDYFLTINEIEKTKIEKDLPEPAYIAWIESVKATYIKKVEENQAGEVKEFVLVENTDNFGVDIAYTQARRALPDLAAKIQLDKLNLDNA